MPYYALTDLQSTHDLEPAPRGRLRVTMQLHPGSLL